MVQGRVLQIDGKPSSPGTGPVGVRHGPKVNHRDGGKAVSKVRNRTGYSLKLSLITQPRRKSERVSERKRPGLFHSLNNKVKQMN